MAGIFRMSGDPNQQVLAQGAGKMGEAVGTAFSKSTLKSMFQDSIDAGSDVYSAMSRILPFDEEFAAKMAKTETTKRGNLAFKELVSTHFPEHAGELDEFGTNAPEILGSIIDIEKIKAARSKTGDQLQYKSGERTGLDAAGAREQYPGANIPEDFEGQVNVLGGQTFNPSGGELGDYKATGYEPFVGRDPDSALVIAKQNFGTQIDAAISRRIQNSDMRTKMKGLTGPMQGLMTNFSIPVVDNSTSFYVPSAMSETMQAIDSFVGNQVTAEMDKFGAVPHAVEMRKTNPRQYSELIGRSLKNQYPDLLSGNSYKVISEAVYQMVTSKKKVEEKGFFARLFGL